MNCAMKYLIPGSGSRMVKSAKLLSVMSKIFLTFQLSMVLLKITIGPEILKHISMQENVMYYHCYVSVSLHEFPVDAGFKAKLYASSCALPLTERINI